jgi:hypothetical protein
MKIVKLFNRFIKYTPKEAKIPTFSIYLTEGYTISSVSLKHLYDKRPAREFDLILIYLRLLVKRPDLILKNKPAKRGSLCYVKEINNELYFCSLELDDELCSVVTCFRIEEDYLNGYILLWSRKGGEPSS